MSAKYVTTKIGEIITRIAIETEVPGYTEGIMEVFLPDHERWSEKKCNAWIKENNARMTAICNFLNKTYKK